MSETLTASPSVGVGAAGPARSEHRARPTGGPTVLAFIAAGALACVALW